MIFDNTFICTVTGETYFIRGQFNCESFNVIYLIICSKCLEQYVIFLCNCLEQMFRTVYNLKLDSAFINPISKLERKDVEVPDILIVSVIMILIRFNTLRSNSWNKYRIII